MKFPLCLVTAAPRLILHICTFHLCVHSYTKEDWQFQGGNIAQGKPATQGPNTYFDDLHNGRKKFYPADLAVDGNTSRRFSDGSCTHTKGSSSEDAFWTVDLQKAYRLTGIIIYNRDSEGKTDVQNRLKNFILYGNTTKVLLYDSRGSEEYKEAVIYIPLDGKRYFSVVSVELPAVHGFLSVRMHYLTLCEVEIYADVYRTPKEFQGKYLMFVWFQCFVPVPTCETVYKANGYIAIFNNTGKIVNGKYSSGTVISLHCSSTFLLDGAPLVKCLDTGAFSPSQLGNCIAQCTGIRKIEHGEVIPSVNKYSADPDATVSCDKGYVANINKTTIYCSPEVSYNPIPTCNIVKCPYPGDAIRGYYVVSNSETSSKSWNEQPFGTVITGLCFSGYESSSNQTRICQKDKTWNGSATICSPVVCPRPRNFTYGFYSLRNGTLINRNDLNTVFIFQYQTVIQARCIVGYNLISLKERTCGSRKIWSGEEPVCTIVTCLFPGRFQNGNYAKHITFKNDKNSLVPYLNGISNYSENITALCVRGYNLTSANNTRVCNSEGFWTGENPVCSQVTCKWPLIINNGRYIISMNLTTERMPYNTTTTAVVCDDSFELVESYQTRRCNEEGTWDGESAVCSQAGTSSNYTGVAVGITSAVVVVLILIVLVFFYRRHIGIKAENTKSMQYTEILRKRYKNVDLTNTAVYEYADINETGLNSRNTTQDSSNPSGIYSNVSTEKHVLPLVESSSSLQTDRAYYSFVGNEKIPPTAVKLQDLAELVLTGADVIEKLRKQFESLPHGMVEPHKEALKPHNKGKNRYKNLYAFDDTRVVLDVEDDSESDYINACFVHGFNQTRKYIASQGPTEEILNDFWKMIWQTQCCKIVMLTNLREEGKVKCEQYWPSHGSHIYGRITVQMKHTEPFSQFVTRTFTLQKDGSPVRNVTQFHFTTWPDRGVPKYASSMVHFLSKVMYFKSHGDGPIVVHCSAGVGRTGTFIALDNVTEQGKAMGYVDVAGVVESMRKQRVNSVQTLEQYIFVYQAVTEALMLSSSAMPAAKFPKAFEELLQTDLKKKKRKMDLEFEALKKMSPLAEESQYVSSKLVRNRNKNRYSNVLPIEEFMPSLTKGDGSEDCEYINAVFLPSYKEKKAFIITQTPLESTVEDFWRLIWEHDVHTLIMINNLEEMTNSEVYWPGDDQTISVGNISVTNDGITMINEHTVFSLTVKKFVVSRHIRLFQVGRWKSQKSLPESTDVILSLMELVQSWQQQTGNRTVLVHCMNGVEKSGLFCVISAVIERMKIEQDVAISQVIEDMRNAREQIISSVEQFQFCHEAVLAFIHQYDTYSNFTL